MRHPQLGPRLAVATPQGLALTRRCNPTYSHSAMPHSLPTVRSPGSKRSWSPNKPDEPGWVASLWTPLSVGAHPPARLPRPGNEARSLFLPRARLSRLGDVSERCFRPSLSKGRPPGPKSDHEVETRSRSRTRWVRGDNGVRLLSFTLPARLAMTPTASSSVGHYPDPSEPC